MHKQGNHEGAARRYIASSMFLTGLCGFVFECILSTSSTHIFGNSTKEWTFTISFMLLMMGLASWIQKFPFFIKNNKLIEQFIRIEMSLALLGAFAPLVLFSVHAYMPEKVGGFQIFLVGSIGFLIGLEIPVAQRINERFANLARNISDTIALDYIGAFVGAQIFYRFFLQNLPLEQISFVVAFFNYVVAVMAYRFFYSRGNIVDIRQTRILVAVTALALVAGYLLTPGITMSQRQKFFRDHVIAERQTDYQHIVVTRNAKTGNHDLFLNGNLQFSGDDEERYHEPLVLPALHLRNMDRRRKQDMLDVLILGGGDGMAADVVRNDPAVKTITLVDIDPKMVKFCASSRIIAQYNHNVFQDAKVAVLKAGAITNIGKAPLYYQIGSVNDHRLNYETEEITELASVGIAVDSLINELQNFGPEEFIVLNYDADWFIEQVEDRLWDVIIIDFPDPRTVELSKLYSWEFYVKLRKILAAGGIIVTQATSPFYAKEVFLCIRRTLQAAGFYTLPYQGFVGSFGGNWGWIIGYLFSEEEMGSRLEAMDNLSSFQIETRFLTPELFRAMRIFGKDDLVAEEYPELVNYLTSAKTLDYLYENAWQKN